MKQSLVIVVIASIFLGACVQDTGLGKDVSLPMPSPSPGLDQVMNQQNQDQMEQQVMGAQQTQQPLPPQPTEMPVVLPTPQPTPAQIATVSGKLADILVNVSTAKGVIELKLYRSEAPNTVANFLKKAQTGFYNNLTFHRVEDWVIQGGDPLGNGTGGGTMPTELNQMPFKIGSLGVARGGDINVSNDSQFFICTDDCSWLTGQYTNFGEVVNGMDVAKKIAIGDKIQSITEVQP